MNSTTTATGRDQSGRFTLGNAGGPGNPYGGRVSRFRKIIMEAVTDEDMDAIAKKLVDLAIEGSLSAIKLLLAYSIGKPGELLFEPTYPPLGCNAQPVDSVDLSNSIPSPQINQPATKRGSDLLDRDFLAPLPNGVFDDAGAVQIVPGKSKFDDRVDTKNQNSGKKKR